MRKRSTFAKDADGVTHHVWCRPDSARLGILRCRREYLTKATRRSNLEQIRAFKGPELLTVSYVHGPADCIDCLADLRES